MSSSQYIRVTQAALSAVEASHLPLYSCKYSKKTYTQHQLLVLLLLKERLRLDYRSFVDLLAIMPPILDILHLDRVPHYTTLHKFLQRIHSLWLTILQKKILSSAYQHGEVVPVAAVDSSGFTSAYASSYYSVRTGKTRKRFLKVALVVDTETQLILAATVTQHPTHDIALAGNLLKQSHRTRKAACYVMDKGFDAERIHRLIREDLGADSLIPLRSGDLEEIRGPYRSELARSFDTKKYHQRNIVETAFSALKRALGESLKARKYRAQAKEIKIKLILYNLKRTSTAGGLRIVIELFYRAETSSWHPHPSLHNASLFSRTRPWKRYLRPPRCCGKPRFSPGRRMVNGRHLSPVTRMAGSEGRRGQGAPAHQQPSSLHTARSGLPPCLTAGQIIPPASSMMPENR